MTEVFCSTGTLPLRELGVDLEGAQAVEWCIALEASAELVEDGCGECDFGGAVEVHDGLERASFAGLGSLVFSEREFVERGDDVLEARDVDGLLGNTLMRGLFVLVNALGKVEAGAHSLAHEVHDVAGNRGGEHEILAFDLFWVGQLLADLVNLGLEALVE